MGHREILLSLPATLDQLSPDCSPTPRASVRRPTASLCAGHAQQLGGESPPANLMEVRPSDDARAIAARRGLKEAWNKRASRWTRTDTRRQRRTSGQRIAKSISIKGAKRRFGGCARKAVELTPGDLLGVASATEVVVRPSDRRAEVSRRHSVR